MDSCNHHDFKVFPKVELHRHLEGSIRLATLNEIARSFDLPFSTATHLQQKVQMHSGEQFNMQNFLAKFQTLREFYLSLEIIQRIAFEAVADAALDGIRYVELMFTPVALARARVYPLDEVIERVLEGAAQAVKDYPIKARFIIGFNRHESPDLAARVTELAASNRHRGVVAVNLAGNEADFPAAPFRQVFDYAHKNGLGVTIHAGEWNTAANIREAILDYRAARVGHGIHVLDDPQLVELVRERQTPFEVCLTSNLQTGAIKDIRRHPVLQMQAAGLNVTLNTDDPSISGITLSSEFSLAYHQLGISLAGLKNFTLAAAGSSFLSPLEQQELLLSLTADLQNYERLYAAT